MSGQRHISASSRPQPVPNSSSASRGRSPPHDLDAWAIATARLASPIPSVSQHSSPPIRQIPVPSRLSSGNQTPLVENEVSRSIVGPGTSALAAALQGSFGASPPRFGTPPLRPLSPGVAGAALRGSGPQTAYGSFESRAGPSAPRRVSGLPAENPNIVKRHLMRPSISDSVMDSNEDPSNLSNETSTATLRNGKNVANGMSDQDEFSSLQMQGGDVTREIYRWAEDAEAQSLLGRRGKRRKSWHDSRHEQDNGALGAGSIKKPGGFRRDYLRRQQPNSSEPSLASPGLGSHDQSARPAPILTKSFYEFLSMYGHFAGGDLEHDDEDITPTAETAEETEDDTEWGETSALLTPSVRGRRRRTLKQKGATGDNSPRSATLLLLKSFIGTGVLFLPKAYLNGGMLFSSLVLLCVALLSYYCFILLVKTRLNVTGSFGEMGGKIYGKPMRLLILGSISLSQVGFVAAYMVFTAENLGAFILAVSKCRNYLNIKWLILFQALIFMPISLIRDISKLGGLALVADAFIGIGLLYLAGYDIHTLSIHGPAEIALFNPIEWTSFIGTAIFTFEGVGLIIPIQESMKDPTRFPTVLAGVMVFITAVFMGMGALSYVAFGPATRTVVLSNLPQDSKFVNGVQLLYSLAILMSTPLQLFPAIRIMETGTFTRSGKQNPYIKWQKNMFRFIVVSGCSFLAWAGAYNLDKFVSVVGTFACIPLVYVYPVSQQLRRILSPTANVVFRQHCTTEPWRLRNDRRRLMSSLEFAAWWR